MIFLKIEELSLHLRIWSFEGIIAAVIALLAVYYVLGSASFALQYAVILGWSAIFGVLVLLVQGAWKTKAYLNTHVNQRGIGFFERAVNQWGGIHVALSIVITIFAIVHGAFFLQSLLSPSVAIWFGAAAFAVLVVVNLSGLSTELKRKSRQFGRFRGLHITLMLAVLGLTLLHVEGVLSGLFLRPIVAGAIVGFLATLAVIIVTPLTDRISSS